MSNYTDDKGKLHNISEEELARAVLYKLESQKEQGRSNWSRIVKMLKADGVDAVKSEGLRQAVKKYQKKIGKLPKRQDFEQSSLTLRLGELSQAKREIQNERREFNKIKRELLDQSIYRNELEKAVREALSDFKANGYDYPQASLRGSEGSKVTQNEQDLGSNALVIVLSDWHIGCQFKTSYNEFSYKIVTNLVAEYLSKIERLIDNYNVEKVLLLNLGDTIENTYMRNFTNV